jgi:5,10-methylene-tetrahydrofolate dehydrogenase/methenyl tetrahydrofolate cyclohydrolase
VVHEPVSIVELVDLAGRLNKDLDVHAVLIQLPVRLDRKLDNAAVYPLIKPWKDVDGLNPVNMGLLAMPMTNPYFVPATASAVMELLQEFEIPVRSRHVCIVGRSAIVGRPLFQLMLRADATVTICHAQTENLEQHLKMADIVVVAIGKAKHIKADWIKPGATVIDVGINEAIENSQRRLVGDVDADEVAKVAGAVTPVPGGIGPLTVAMLMRNVLRAFELQHINNNK